MLAAKNKMYFLYDIDVVPAKDKSFAGLWQEI